MNKVVVFFILILSYVHAQESSLDSLRSILRTTSNDTIRCKVLFELAETAPDLEWEQYNTQLKDLTVQKLNTRDLSGTLTKFYTKYLAIALNNEAVISQDKGHTYEALKKYHESCRLSQKTNDKASVATALNNIGTIYERIGILDSALFFYKQSLQICELIKDLKGASNSLSNIGSAYQQKGNYGEALNFYSKSFSLSSKINDKEGKALSLSKTGSIQFELEDYDNALKNLNAAIQIREETKNLSGLAELYNSKGAIYMLQKKYVEANEYHMKALKIGYELKDPVRIAYILNNIATLLDANNNHLMALDSLFKAYHLLKSISSSQQCSPLQKISSIYLNQSQYSEAKKYALEALQIAKLNNEAETLPDIYKTLFTIYKSTNKHKEALEIYDLYSEASQKINNNEHLKKSYQSHYKYEYILKAFQDSLKTASERQVFALKLKQERTNFYLFILGVAFLLAVSIFIFLQYKQKQKQKIIRLRNKIANDLHDDVGSALSSIKLLAGISKTDIDQTKKNELVSKIEQTSLETIDAMNDIIWSVNTKNDSIRIILDKMTEFGEKICYPSNIQFELNNDHIIQETLIDLIQRKNIYLIFKEAVNNAVKYSGAKKISVSLKRLNKKIVLTVTDNGKGFNAQQLNSTGNGLENMKTRAKEAGGSLNIVSNNLGTTILLEIKTT